MRALFHIVLCLLSVTITATQTHANMYKWTDKDGNVQFSDTPPEKSDSKVQTFSSNSNLCELEQLVMELVKANKINKKALKLIVSSTQDGTLARSIIKQPAGMDDLLVPFFHSLADEQDRCAAGNKAACACIQHAISGETGPRSITPAIELPLHATQKTPGHQPRPYIAEKSDGDKSALPDSVEDAQAIRNSPATLGPEGGTVNSADGAILTLSRKALSTSTDIEITPIKEDELPTQLPKLFSFAGAYRIKLGASSLELPAQLMTPGNRGFTPGTKVVVLHPTRTFISPDSSTATPCWAQIAEGVVASNGSLQTIENTMPGIRWGATYVLGVVQSQAIGKVRGFVSFFFPRVLNSMVHAMATLNDGQILCQGIDRDHFDYTMVLPTGSHTIRIVENLEFQRKEIEQRVTIERGNDAKVTTQFINLSNSSPKQKRK